MKHLLFVLTVMLSAWSFQVGAATFDLGEVSDNADIGNRGLSGAFEDSYTFTVPSNNIGGSFSVTNSFVVRTNAGFIENFVATLDGVSFTGPAVIPGTQVLSFDLASALASGVHELVVSGVGVAVNGRTASYGGSIQIDTAVPVPAAVWLFGSALVGLFGAKRRQAHA